LFIYVHVYVREAEKAVESKSIGSILLVRLSVSVFRNRSACPRFAFAFAAGSLGSMLAFGTAIGTVFGVATFTVATRFGLSLSLFARCGLTRRGSGRGRRRSTRFAVGFRGSRGARARAGTAVIQRFVRSGGFVAGPWALA
jgi:hypothetical protein